MPKLSALVRAVAACAVLAALLPASDPVTAAEPLAKDLFGAEQLPADGLARSYGFYSKGCFAGGVAIAVDGPHWQAMRLSRNRRWGNPEMIKLLERLSEDGTKVGWSGLMVGDISQPRGGPMLSGHASHQIGLDADIWFTPMPNRRLSAQERESFEPKSLIKKGGLTVDDKLWTPAHMAILKQAASYPNVERIFVHPGIKKKLCDTVRGDRSWLNKIRPLWGHDYHFHVRIGCPAGSVGCKDQDPTGSDDGCGKSLAWWFTDEPWKPATGPQKPRARDVMTMASLPKQCRAVLDAPSPASEAAVTIGGPAGTLKPASAVPVTASSIDPDLPSAVPVPSDRPTR